MSLNPISHSRPWITEGDQRSVAAVLGSGMIAQGALTLEFERSISEYLGVTGGIATASGTAALTLALRTLDVGPGQEVVLPTYVCRAVLDAVITVGATPVFCDVGDGWVMTRDTVGPRVSSRTRAIIVVHTFGFQADIDAIESLGVPVIEDACQALGLTIDGVQAGGLGTIGCLSFHATKCLTTGEGGMLVTDSPELLNRAKTIRDGDGLKPRTPAPLSDLQAALGLSQLARYSEFLERRRKILTQYRTALKDEDIICPEPAGACFRFRFPLRIPGGFDRAQQHFIERGIHVRRGVDELLHRLLGLSDELFPHAVALFEETLSVPFYPGLTPAECQRVSDALVTVER